MKTLNVGSFASNIVSAKQALIICLTILAEFNSKTYSFYNNKEIFKKIYSNAELSPKETASLDSILGGMIKKINRYAPPFTFFGYHPTDHTILGVWLDLLALHKGEEKGSLTQISKDSWRGLKCTYILDIGKAGITLYHRRDKKIIWAML